MNTTAQRNFVKIHDGLGKDGIFISPNADMDFEDPLKDAAVSFELKVFAPDFDKVEGEDDPIRVKVSNMKAMFSFRLRTGEILENRAFNFDSFNFTVENFPFHYCYVILPTEDAQGNVQKGRMLLTSENF